MKKYMLRLSVEITQFNFYHWFVFVQLRLFFFCHFCTYFFLLYTSNWTEQTTSGTELVKKLPTFVEP
jgi:hypothetical protein